eukprot:gnl/TRDRNA2_/TRDRNA2_182917_c0_seq1.p2 gnl/TRDRNA2_/TRDRNA2_182917_c0~~gnl/TRDRNA2_/TRDRNA2_182917_c0_seq1.p2  ORF type:complete len:144 (-),score=18.67 gnl/TRDRNA2_/TRDRNA2_182917_c0_seq1:14-409(-)
MSGDDDGIVFVEGEVQTDIPLEVFAEGLQARKVARALVRAKEEPTRSQCEEVKMSCENGFRTLRDAYLNGCMKQTHRCNRLRDLLGECQIQCEAAEKRCMPRPPSSTLFQTLGGRGTTSAPRPWETGTSGT